jgi:hypothetical protein
MHEDKRVRKEELVLRILGRVGNLGKINPSDSSWSKAVNTVSRFLGLSAVVGLVLSILVAPAGAHWRGRQRCVVQRPPAVVCPPTVLCQPPRAYPVSAAIPQVSTGPGCDPGQSCYYCNANNRWESVQPGQNIPCVCDTAGQDGTWCSSSARRSKPCNNIRLQKGYGLYRDCATGWFHWYSDKLSTKYCSGTNRHNSPCANVIAAIPRGFCVRNGTVCVYWDIYVRVNG